MRYPWIDQYLLAMPAVTKDLQAEWNWIRYQIDGKMFAAICLDDATGKPVYITLKLDPEEGEFFRQQYEDVIPGYYMNKVHWNSIKADGAVQDDLLREMLEKSYRLVLSGFSKRNKRNFWKGKSTMAFDYKKEYKEFYFPPKKPHLITVPAMNFVAVRGKGNPNDPNGEYKTAMELLYGIAFTIKMSYKGSHQIDGYFEYVVPPLEGLWQQPGVEGVDFAHKETYTWTSMIRLPEFVTRETFDWAVQEATAKKKKDFSKAEFLTYEEGLCVQCMHIGPYDAEPETLAQMDAFAAKQGCELDFSDTRFHHEIYLGDPRRTAPEKLKTVLRHPVRKNSQKMSLFLVRCAIL